MNWHLMPRGEIAAMALMAAFIVVLLFVLAAFPDSSRPTKSNGGFGPRWDCTGPGRGEPICIKVRPTNTKN